MLKQYESKNITEFSLQLSTLQRDKHFRDYLGIYLSALINLSRENNFLVYTNHLDKLLSFVGWENMKDITIIGDVGCYVGANMKKGSIVVNENTEYSVGSGMNGGRVVVEGNVNGGVGNEMSGGEIYLNGNYGGIAWNVQGGNIYHQGEFNRKKRKGG